MDEALRAAEDVRAKMLETAKDEHGVETIERAFLYASRRIEEGSVTTAMGAKSAFAAFADGFCTGFHRGSGTACTR